MASRFIALPLPSGEAFLLETKLGSNPVNILLDSGQKYAGDPHPLVNALEHASRHLNKIDIAICTHQDADHSNGFRTFADAWCGRGRTIGEFWLPGRWAAAVPQILYEPSAIVSKIWRAAHITADRLSAEGSEGVAALRHEEQLLRDIAPAEEINALFEPAHRREGAVREDDDNSRSDRLAESLGLDLSSIEGLRRTLEEADSITNVFEMFSLSDSYVPPWWFDDDGRWLKAATLFQGAIDTAKTIAAIAEAAVRWTIPIRWFDFKFVLAIFIEGLMTKRTTEL